jgi:hypothetical protein
MWSGLLAEFETPEAMMRALEEVHRRGWREIDSFTPYPVRAAEAIVGAGRSPINWILFPIAFGGAGLAFLFQWFCNAYDYPLNVGGRPLDSVLSFIPITFETGVLFAAVSGLLVFLLLSGLPQLYSPIFRAPGFERATIDRFWVGVDERDPAFNRREVERAFRGVGATSIVWAGGES